MHIFPICPEAIAEKLSVSCRIPRIADFLDTYIYLQLFSFSLCTAHSTHTKLCVNTFSLCPPVKALPTVTRGASIHMINRKLQIRHIIILVCWFSCGALADWDCCGEKETHYTEAIAGFTLKKKGKQLEYIRDKESEMKFYSCLGYWNYWQINLIV